MRLRVGLSSHVISSKIGNQICELWGYSNPAIILCRQFDIVIGMNLYHSEFDRSSESLMIFLFLVGVIALEYC